MTQPKITASSWLGPGHSFTKAKPARNMLATLAGMPVGDQSAIFYNRLVKSGNKESSSTITILSGRHGWGINAIAGNLFQRSPVDFPGLETSDAAPLFEQFIQLFGCRQASAFEGRRSRAIPGQRSIGAGGHTLYRCCKPPGRFWSVLVRVMQLS